MSKRPAGVWAESAQRNKDPTPQGVPAFHVLCVSLLLYNYSKALVSSGQLLRLHPQPILTQIRQWTMEEEKSLISSTTKALYKTVMTQTVIDSYLAHACTQAAHGSNFQPLLPSSCSCEINKPESDLKKVDWYISIHCKLRFSATAVIFSMAQTQEGTDIGQCSWLLVACS